MHAGLASTLLLQLPPGATFRQSSHVVLLRGQLAAESASASPATAGAPQVLPWLADPRLGLGGAEERQWRAGSTGALLLVWLTAAGEEPAGVAEAEKQAQQVQPTVRRLSSGPAAEQPADGGRVGRRLMPWQHPFVRRPNKPGA